MSKWEARNSCEKATAAAAERSAHYATTPNQGPGLRFGTQAWQCLTELRKPRARAKALERCVGRGKMALQGADVGSLQGS